MKTSSRLQSLQSGMTVQVEATPDQLSKIRTIARVRNSEIISEEAVPGERVLLTLRKK